MSITLAVVGCGRIAENAHIPALKQLSARVKYCVDIIPERAQRAAEKLNAVKAITDYKTALADKEVDAVYVLTPNFAHYTITMMLCSRASMCSAKSRLPFLTVTHRKWRKRRERPAEC